MSAIVALKKEWGPKLEAQGVKLTYMPFFIKAHACSRSGVPVGERRGARRVTMVVKKYYNIGMAVGRDEKGLIVPEPRRTAIARTLVQIAAEVNDLAARARTDRLRPDDIQGGTFSITNAGVFGAINSSPVINVPGGGDPRRAQDRRASRHPRRPDRGAADDERRRSASITASSTASWRSSSCAALRELLERPEMLWFHA